MVTLLETIKNIINELDIPELVVEKLNEIKPPVNGYDYFALEDMLTMLFEDIMSETLYSIDVWRQEQTYGKANLPKLKELIRQAFLNKIYPIKLKNRKLIIRLVPDTGE